jgi:hypothetical protein
MQTEAAQSQTPAQFDAVIKRCKELFMRKAADYGTAWVVLRLPSVTDQLYIKARRIRSIEETGVNKVGDSIEGEYVGLINYSVIALLLYAAQSQSQVLYESGVYPMEQLEADYDRVINRVRTTLLAKNHDYGEAWRQMRLTSYTDLILMRLLRIKQIEDNGYQTLVSEQVDAHYIDLINYSVFALIKLNWAQA